MDGEIGQKVADDVAEKLNVRCCQHLLRSPPSGYEGYWQRDYKTGRFKRCQFKDA